MISDKKKKKMELPDFFFFCDTIKWFNSLLIHNIIKSTLSELFPYVTKSKKMYLQKFLFFFGVKYSRKYDKTHNHLYLNEKS